MSTERVPIDRRTFLQGASLLTAGVLAPACALTRRNEPFDLVLRGGTIVDGTGARPYTADVGVRGDRILAIAAIDEGLGRKVIDVRGLCVSPGFIDMHSHSDRSILDCPTADSRVRQGYTSEVTGNCGGSAAPRVEKPKAEAVDPPADKAGYKLGEKLSEKRRWTDVASYFRVLRACRISINHALLIGQGTLRENAIGPVDRQLTDRELGEMVHALEQALDQGAHGLSTGLEYVPGIWTPTDEIVALANTLKARGKLYASHMRNEDARLLEAIDEALEVGRRSGARVEISHLKAAGKINWKKQDAALAKIEEARRAGIDVMADAYPYTAYSTGLTILLEAWARDGGEKALLNRLADPSDRARIKTGMIDHVENEPGGFELIVISSRLSEKNRAFTGKSIAEIGASWGIEPADALLRLLEEEKTDVSFIGHAMSRENVEKVLAHPLVMVGSDGYAMKPKEKSDESTPHPRSYGTCARVLGEFCRERAVFDLPTAVKKMTSLPAERAGLEDRGRIIRGLKADLVAFDAMRIKDETTFDAPQRFPSGIPYVIVNGVLVVEDGHHTGARPGVVL